MLRKLAWAVVGLLVLVVALWFGGRAYLARSVAQYEGTAQLAGLSAPVDVTFDARGVPQIWARTDADAFRALGYLHASERLFQMELVRRLARGELAEVFGEAALETDERQRRVGFARRAAQDATKLDAASRAALEHYVAGINEWIAQSRLLPPELVILRIDPRPWTIVDCLAVAGYQTWFSHELMDQDRRYQLLIKKIGAPAQLLTGLGHPWSPPTVPDSFLDPLVGASRLRVTTASNSWAVAPSRSKSGAALHAADPHLSIDQAPGLWYLAGLHSAEGLDVVGVTYGGGPFVVMGHNDAIAFSFTVASIDLIDYFDDSASSTRTVARESIRVKGEDKPRLLEVKESPRGVLIDERTSMHWAGFDFSGADLVAASLRLQKARTFDDFRRAVTRFGALDANWIYSDRSGNIGYQLGAPVPIRDYDTYVRQPANDPRIAWRGYRALDETPHALNPGEGFLASCNNQPVSRNWPTPLPGFFDPYRITRANTLLGGSRKLGREEMHTTQLDLVSGLATRWKDTAAAGARRAGMQADATSLARWNGSMDANSREATLFAAWWKVLPRHVFEDELGAEWKSGAALLDQTLTSRSPILDDRRTPAVETLDDISARAMREAHTIANDRKWGEASTLLVRHPLARVKILDRWLRLNRGPLPAPGDAGTLDANFFSFHEESRSFRSSVGPSMRFVLDWSNVDSFTLTGALGQSGNPFSPHYANFLPMMRRGEAWPVPFTRAAVEARKTSSLRLVPR